MTCRSK